jgi:hypothetical protein
MAAASLVTEPVAMSGQNLAPISRFEYQAMKLKAETTRWEQEKDERIRHQQSESLRVASYNSELLRVVSEFQDHIADQHQQFVSCKECRRWAKEIRELSKRIEGGVR